jgi:hypothetical protein
MCFLFRPFVGTDVFPFLTTYGTPARGNNTQNSREIFWREVVRAATEIAEFAVSEPGKIDFAGIWLP